MNVPVFDLHCDTVNELIGSACKTPISLRKNSAHIDLERASKLGSYAQCFACFTTPSAERNPVDVFEKMLGSLIGQIEANHDLIRIAYSAREIEANKNNGLMSAILTLEGTAGFGYDPALLEDLYNIGFRISSLGWNENNLLTGSHVTGGGLTDRGRQYVLEAQRLGMLIDVSHISDEGFWDIMEITQAPILATHSNSRHICNASRNLTDDMFRAICNTGGVAGINLYTDFIGGANDLDALCDHVFHFMELDPSGKHIALGGDLDGCDTLCAGISGIQDYTGIADKLLERGLTQQNVLDIFWNNAIGVIDKCCM